MADPYFVIRCLANRGCHLRLQAGQVIARMESGKVPEDLATVIRNKRDLVFDYLAEQQRIAETVVNVLALTDADYQRWRSEVTTAAPNDPNIEHDRAALTLAIRAKHIEALTDDGEVA